MDTTPNLPPATTAEMASLLAQLEEANERVRRAEAKAQQTSIKLQLSDLRIAQLEETLRLLRLKKYGPQSERLSLAQLQMFDEEPSATLDEVAAEAARGPLGPVPPAGPKRNRKDHPGRQTLPAHLPRVVKTIGCEAAQCTCGQCGKTTAVIGYEESERLDVKPAKFFVTVTRREKRACQSCKQSGVATAAVPAQIIEKGLASDRVVINTVVGKYCDHLPLYRQSAMLLRDAGVVISRVTLDGMVMRVGELLEVIQRAMKREVQQGGYIQADETTVAVQRSELKKGRHHQAYLWQFGNPGGTVVFEFHLGRSAEAPRSFLHGYRGILQTDGYAGYNNVGGPEMVHAGCWAHTRRYAVDAVKLNPSDAVACDLVRRMDALFAVDRAAREGNLSLEARHALRREKSAALVAGIHEKLLAEKDRVLPKSKLGEGISYGLGHWRKLTRFLEHPEVELSNNLAENSMRPTVQGRKNWLHIGSVAAGPRVAAIVSVVETCRRLDIPVRQYLAEVLPGLADRKMADVAELTPAAWKRRHSL